ncbi:fasciclin domain-containing protein [Erythrobacter sp. MTPC3]|uniref:fasciclin domain-containing protein n=1 Tax=Erythrobacter sp. MTPC3 TaxID=3056564 RepID=UPI0036F19C34
MKIATFKAGLIASLALTLSACGSDTEMEGAPGTSDRSGDALAEVITDEGNVSVMGDALEKTGLAGVLEGEANYTLLAPTDTAFEALGEQATAMLADEDRGAIVAAILREHMVPGALTPDAIRSAIGDNGGEVSMTPFGSGDLTWTLDGEDIVVTNAGGQTARLSGNAIAAKNGVLIPIDTVLVDPQSLAGSPALADQ